MIAKLLHPAATLAAALLFELAFGLAWVGALAFATGFVFRELAQAEYRWIERYGKRFESPADYANWHYVTFGQYEGRPPLESWEEYFEANPDLHVEWLNLAGSRASLPWWGGFDPRVWNLHSLLGWLLPVAVVVAMVGLI